jgi:hypothetical protein
MIAARHGCRTIGSPATSQPAQGGSREMTLRLLNTECNHLLYPRPQSPRDAAALSSLLRSPRVSCSGQQSPKPKSACLVVAAEVTQGVLLRPAEPQAQERQDGARRPGALDQLQELGGRQLGWRRHQRRARGPWRCSSIAHGGWCLCPRTRRHRP